MPQLHQNLQRLPKKQKNPLPSLPKPIPSNKFPFPHKNHLNPIS
jgi:hypothetical protein